MESQVNISRAKLEKAGTNGLSWKNQKKKLTHFFFPLPCQRLDGMIISHFPHGPTAFFTLNNVVLRHDIKDHGTVSEAFPHLIFNNFTSKLGKRTADILKYLFPVPKEDSKRVMTFSNDNDFISFRHHVFIKTSHKDVQLAEVGPRFEMKRMLLGYFIEKASLFIYS